MKEKKSTRSPGFALPLILIVIVGVGSFFIQIVFNKGKKDPLEGCEYDKKIFPAEVVAIREMGNGNNEVFFRVETDLGIDTLVYSKEFKSYASGEQLQRKDIKPGEQFQYHVQDLLKGDCSKHVEVLALEKY